MVKNSVEEAVLKPVLRWMSMTTYRLADRIDETVAAELAAYPPLTAQLLAERGITTKAAAEKFMQPSYDDHLHDPMLLPDMEVAVERILAAIDAKEQIVIYSDYDCDGIPGGVILHDFFTAIGYENFTNHIPHRHFEGFGFSVAAAEKLAAEGAKLIITIDCGTTDVAAVAKAAELGVDVVITDHHLPGSELPEAVAIVNPQIGDSYPFTGLCGAAVIFKVAQALLASRDFGITPGKEKWWLDMVGIATIADMVPLVDENRVLARYGLQVLRKSRRPGLQQLLRKQRAHQPSLTEDDIGFTIGPRINAASRMDTPDDAFNLLATTDEGEAGAQVARLESLNNERKGLVAAMTKDLHGRMKKLTELPEVFVMGDPAWRPSLVGLAANKLAEEYHKPTFLWGKDGNGVIKGSCRSDGKVSVVKLMAAIEDSFLEHGGHHMAGGFAVRADAIFDLPAKFNEAFIALGAEASVPQEVVIDAELTLADIDTKLLQMHQQLAPFGHSNAKPLYRFAAVTPSEVAHFGKGKEHLRLTFATEQGSVEAIAFFKTAGDWEIEPVVGTPLTLIGHVEQSYFMGRHQTRVRIVDIV